MITKTQLYLLSKLPNKIQTKVEILESGCWVWKGEINRNGYGRCYHKGKRPVVHRLIWMLLRGEIAEGLLLDHVYSPSKCSRDCCNPTHVSAVTHRHNTHRGKATLYVKR